MTIDPATRDRLFGHSGAFTSPHPVTLGIVVALAVGLFASGLLIQRFRNRDQLSDQSYRELYARWRSWCWLVVVIVVPILLGAAWLTIGVVVLSLLCFREFSRATGLFRDKAICAVVVLGTLLVAFASLDHWEDDRLFFALGPLVGALIVIVTIPQDRPRGFMQRTALGLLGFALFGFSLGYLSNIANVGDLGNDIWRARHPQVESIPADAASGVDYRPILLFLLVAVEINDIFAFCSGKLFGGRKLLPNTSPNKTLAGAAGALLLTTILVCAVGWFLFAGTAMQRVDLLMGLGVMISLLGQLGDLTLSSIKRDVGLKDIGATLPGHGGVLDRFDSLVLVPPAVYHYLSAVLGPLGGATESGIITGSLMAGGGG